MFKLAVDLVRLGGGTRARSRSSLSNSVAHAKPSPQRADFLRLTFGSRLSSDDGMLYTAKPPLRPPSQGHTKPSECSRGKITEREDNVVRKVMRIGRSFIPKKILFPRLQHNA